MSSKKIIVSLGVMMSFGLANYSLGADNPSRPIIIHSEKDFKQRVNHQNNPVKKTTHLIKYHTRHNGITLFYDEEKTFSNFISLKDQKLGRAYGVINNNNTTLYDQNLNSLGLYIYLLSDKTGHKYLKVQGDSKKYSKSWLNDLGNRLTKKNVAIFSLLLGPSNVAQGISIKAGKVSYDTITDSNQAVITGQRIQLGDLVLADWWTKSGEIKGFSHKRGKISFYTFTMEDGAVISGSTLEIPGLNGL